jgi:hypothetical protein
MNASYKNTHLEETLAVIAELNHCAPRKLSERQTTLETKAEHFSKWSMILAGTSVFIVGVMAVVHKLMVPLADFLVSVALALVFISATMALLALIAPIIAAALTLLNWKSITLKNLLDDIRHEQSMVFRLSHHKAEALIEAKCWLELKIKRVDARVSHFFGEKTAFLGLLATGWFFAKEFGGLSWISTTLTAGARWGNLANITLLMVGAGVFGMSIGAVMIRHIGARYRYQVQLLEMAQR